MPSNTQIKIRYGMIMQAVLSQALKDAGYSFAETPAYDPDCEVPDFLIPNAEKPQFMVEVHQTEARNHFQMKTLRSVTAVAEAKAFFGPDLISVNVLFGDPDRELPAANLRAMCGIFDTNLILRREASKSGKEMIADLERVALEHATNVKLATAEACRKLCASHPKAVAEFSRLLRKTLDGACMKEALKPMWVAERRRRRALGVPPEPGEQTFYKKNMVRSLFFQDEHFAVMVANPHPEQWETTIVRQLVATGIGTVTEEIDGDHLSVDAEFLSFLRDPDASRLRGLCKGVLDATPSMHWFFEDIRDESRRREMARLLIAGAQSGELEQLVMANFRGEAIGDIRHERNWVVDAARAAIGASQNDLSQVIYNELQNIGGFLYPISHIGPNTAQFRALPSSDKCAYAKDIVEAISRFEVRNNVQLSLLKESLVVEKLLSLRFVGAMRLRRLDVLVLVAASIGRGLKLDLQPVRLDSILGDFAGQRAVSRFELFNFVSEDQRKALINFVAAEGNPRDKAKEWGARRLATLYRLSKKGESRMPAAAAIFVVDGVWAQSDVTRLYRCGWTHVVRMGQLEATLCKVFGIPEPKTKRPSVAAPVRMEDLEDLPMAAEED